MNKKTVFVLLALLVFCNIIFTTLIGSVVLYLGFDRAILSGGKGVGDVFLSKNSEMTVNVVREESAIIEAVNKAKESVVSVVITKDLPVFEDNFDWFWFGPRRQIGTEQRQVGAGTGFIVDKNGLIITNRHVVQDERASYTVVFNDGEKYEARVLARDSLLDIAFLKIDARRDLIPLSLGSSAELKVGQTVIAIGNALGEFSNTVSLGIISGLKRSIVASDGMSGSELLSDVIQTDASINRGNSGGPLLDIKGNVIGVNVAVASQAENIGFAIPIDLVKDLLTRLSQDGSIERPKLGVRYMLVTPKIAKEEGLPYEYGAIIVKGSRRNQLAVVPGSPADKAGLQENDIILEVNGEKVTEKNPLANLIQSFRFGDVVTLKVWKKGELVEVKVKLEKF
jgi:serine protease Do